MTRSWWISAPLALAASLIAAGCGATPHSAAPSPAQVHAAFAGSPAPLQTLHGQADALLATSPTAFRAQLDGLRGFPVIVNKWASWCGPCRQEFPAFQRAAVKFGRQVAFIGLDSFDNAGNARTFLREFPITYPSFADPDDKVANALRAGAFFPTTLFFDATGKLSYTHQGGYSSAAALETDVRRYALLQRA
jgi:thiol-disulfide isomerase/thioredoxin